MAAKQRRRNQLRHICKEPWPRSYDRLQDSVAATQCIWSVWSTRTISGMALAPWPNIHNIQWNSTYRLMAITSFAGSSATQHCPLWFISICCWSSLTLIWIKTPEKTCQGKHISGWTFNSVWLWCAETHINASMDQIKQCSVRHCWRFSKGQCIFLSKRHVI